ncbi:MAG TPA: CYTH domain-containing protein [Draconibacterium sp.]|nr:CYTH domain-containing protein [Draconibacterium sp.]
MLEIERKFLVNAKKWNPKSTGEQIIQGYLSTDKERVVRVRVKGAKAFLTIKGNQQGISRTEMEYEIPVEDAKVLMEMCLDNPIEKVRYREEIAGKIWEIDVFDGKNKGLILAEVELESEGETVEIPEWVTEEVSTDKRYFNAWLSNHPFLNW